MTFSRADFASHGHPEAAKTVTQCNNDSFLLELSGCEKKSKAKILMKRSRVIVIAWIVCWTFAVSGQEYELEELTAARAVRLIAESEEGAINLIFPNVSSIDRETAEELAKAPQSGLLLDGLSSIDEDTASELAHFSGFVLTLNGLTSVSPEVAQQLSTFKGRALVLNGVSTISRDLASNLAEFKGHALFLDGLTNVNREAAQELIAFNGRCLGLYGLKIINEKLMSVLINWPGEKLSVRKEALTVESRDIMNEHTHSWELVGDVWASF